MSEAAWPRGELAPSSRERARAANALLRARRQRRRPTFYQVYVTILLTGIGGALLGGAISTAVGPGLSAHALGVLGPAALLLVVLAALRFGTWQGPVSFSAADVALLLAAPIALGHLVRPKLDQGLVAGAVAGAAVGAVVLLSSAGGAGAGPTLCVVVGFASLGALCAAASWVVQSSRRVAGLVARASPAIVLLAGAFALAAENSALGRTIALWSGPWGWSVAPLAGVSAWPVAVALLVLLTAGAIIVARHRAGSASLEQFLTRAETRAGITASLTTLDYRSASLTQRAAGAGGRAGARGRRAGGRAGARGRRLRRVPRPGSPRFAVLWRDALALIRSPARLAWATLLSAAGTWEALTHPGRPIAAALAALALYFAAGLLSEPLRVDVDHPAKSRLLLSWDFARVLVAHCAVPWLALLAVCAATIAAAVIAGAAAPGALALIPTLALPLLGSAVLCAAQAARRGGRIDESLLARITTTAAADPTGGLTAVIWLMPWLLVCAAVCGAPVLLVGHAVAHHRAVVQTAILALAGSAVAAGWIFGVARRAPAPLE